MKKADLVIVVDTREQTPWTFGEGIQIIPRALPAGDYSIFGWESTIAIERKSLNDLVNTVIHSRQRFQNELHKLASYRRKLVAIEGSTEDILERRYNSDAHPASVLGSVLSLQAIFNVPFCFWSSRQCAQRMAQNWLEHVLKRTIRWQEQEKEKTEGYGMLTNLLLDDLSARAEQGSE